jgi:hypothetical protein
MTTPALRLAQARQLTVRKILFSRLDALVRCARGSDAFARLFSGQRLEEFELALAESATRLALRHNGREPADHLLGATRALAAAITALVVERAERAERGNYECDVKKLGKGLGHGDLAAARHAFCLLGLERRDDERRFLWSERRRARGWRAPPLRVPWLPQRWPHRVQCAQVKYCSRASQKLPWAAHKAACKITSPRMK